MEYNRYYKPKDIYFYLLIALVIFSCACSLAIQVLIISASLRNVLNYLPWIITIGYMVIYLNYTNFTHFKILLFLAVPFGQMILGRIMGLVYDDSLTRALIIVAMVFSIGVLLGEYLEQKHFDFILKCIVIITLLVGLYTYFTVFGGGGLYNSSYGGYNKNALGLIFAVPVVIMLFNNNVFYRLKFIFVPFLVLIVILCASRTSMVCCLVAIIARVFIGNRNWKEKSFYTAIISIVIISLFTNEAFYEQVITNVFFKGHEKVTDENIYQITSGRNKMWAWFSSAFKENWFIGGLGYSFENFYLDTLCKVGLMGAIPIFAFIFSPIYFYFKDRNNKNTFELRNMLVALCMLMCVNGIGEEMSPLGPGVKCFVLWLSFGFYIGLRNKTRELEYLQELEDEEVEKENEEYESIGDNTSL